MLPATDAEIAQITEYVESRDSGFKVTFVQKMHVENIGGIRHEAWDVHGERERFWVITNPTNMYEQKMFPKLDLAITFHVGLCLRIPRSEKQRVGNVEPFQRCVRLLDETTQAVTRAEEVSDFQAIGVRCRETLIALIDVAQVVMPWTGPGEAPKKADLKAWADHLCAVGLGGGANEDRRKLLKPSREHTTDDSATKR